jgi:hypothetical protein
LTEIAVANDDNAEQARERAKPVAGKNLLQRLLLESSS